LLYIVLVSNNDTKKLLEMLKEGLPKDAQDVDKSLVRYALYARKSNTDEEKQEKSVPHQITECTEKIIVPQGLKIVEIYRENFSAKESGTRDEFKRMVEDIKNGRIDGVIAWHPDRLARNMKDAGEIIDMIDRGRILDLQFATFTFENNPAGKMLLGITFVVAKQYSEHLSESVLWGNRKHLEEGTAIGKFKHGYRWDANYQFQPDENYFTTVQKMFRMALDGHSQKDIREWINSQDYKVQKTRGSTPVEHKWSKDNVSNLLRDPHYAGVHILGQNVVDLIKAHDFMPMITVDEFLKINKISSLKSSKIISIARPKTGDIRANLLRGVVECGHCSDSLTSMIIDKKDKQTKQITESRYYYKCENNECEMFGKSARAKYVIDVARAFFRQYLFITEDNYDEYVKNAKEAIELKTKRMKREIGRVNVEITKSKSTYEESKQVILDSPKLAEHYNLDKQLKAIKQLEKDYQDLLTKRRESKSSIVTYEQYLKLLQSTPVILGKMDNMEAMDALLRIFFSNFTIIATGKDFRQGSKVTYKLKEPWEGFLKDGKFVSGAGEGNSSAPSVV
jgi:DNA invertase Pin-like site-specific DNA recombinase